MHNQLAAWVMSLGVLAWGQNTQAQDAANKVVVTIATVQESDWQREMAQNTNQKELRAKLHAKTLVELSGELSGEKELILRSGKEHGIVTRWEFTPDRNDVAAKKTTPEFIGTEVKVANAPASKEIKGPRLSITLTHDLQPLEMQPMTYATAATGAERDKKTVSAPLFQRLRWQGDMLVGKDEQLLTSFLLDETPGTRIAVFIQGGHDNASPPITLRQTIYRVPEMDVIEWMLAAPQNDAALEKRLQQAVADGQAKVVSSLTTSAVMGIPTQAQSGKECWVPTEVDQDLSRLYQLPVSFAAAPAGSRLESLSSESVTSWKSHFAPHPPLAVQWPTSWLRVQDQTQTTPPFKAIHGWMDWYDRFDQETSGKVVFHDESPHLISMMPPADQTWGADRKGRWLDVTMAQRTLSEGGPQDAPSKPSQSSMLILGIALDSDEAQALLATRQPDKDAELLHELVARVKAGRAHVVTSALSANQSGRMGQTSGRLHAYPTEMPSIPSAWGETTVGTTLERDGGDLAFTQDLAPPARTEWKLARDMPEAIMWQPRFRKLFLHSIFTNSAKLDTQLCAVASIPSVIAGGDLPEHETVLLFTHRPNHGAAPKATGIDFELEAMIFEIPAGGADDWQDVKSDDFTTFTQQRLKQGTAKLQSHTMLRIQPATRGALNVTEEYKTATAFDPPSAEAPFRMRPTSLTSLPVGTQLEADVAAAPGGIPRLSVALRHSIARPIEPGLEETLKIAASGKDDYPGAKHEFEEWTCQDILFPAGTVHCLGLSLPAGGGVTTTRIAFIRVRPAQ
jgi:hypothetical protein